MAWNSTVVDGSTVDYSADHNEQINQITQRHKYHGFENRTDSTLTWTNSTPDRTLTITGTYKYYYQGTLVQKTAATDSVQITNTAGLWWIYFSDGAGTLTASQGYPALTTTVVVATVWWNGTAGFICDERHGYDRNLSWHGWAHQTIGIRYQTGLAFTFTPATPTVAFALGSGTLWDEDIAFSVPASSAYVPTAHAGRIFYKTAATTFTCDSAVSTRPYKWNSGTSRVQFVDSANAYALTDIDSAKYVNVFLYGTMDKNVLSSGNGTNAMFVCETIAGGTGYNTTALARDAPVPDISNMGLNPEIKLLYRIVVKGDGTVQTAATADDYRNISYGVAGGTAGTTAASISFAPSGSITATNVQTAIEQVGATPVFHATSHYTGGTDPLTPSNIGAMAVGATPVFHSSSHQYNGSDTLGKMYRTIFLSLAGGWASTTYGDGGFTTTECTTTSGATATTWNLKGTFFDTGTTNTNHEFTAPMPANWDGGTVTAKPYFMIKSVPTTGQWLVLGIQGAVLKSGYAATACTWGLAASSFFSLTASDQNKVYVGASATPSAGVTAITLGSPSAAAGGDLVQWKVHRANALTNYVGGATVLGWMITYGTNKYSDEV